jgi:hypothetical protein
MVKKEREKQKKIENAPKGPLQMEFSPALFLKKFSSCF